MARPRRYGEKLVAYTVRLKPTQVEFLNDLPNASQFVRDLVDKAILSNENVPEPFVSDRILEINRKVKDIESNLEYQEAKRWYDAVGERSSDEIHAEVIKDFKDWRPFSLIDNKIIRTSWHKLEIFIEDDRAREWFNAPYYSKPKEMYEAIPKVIMEKVEKHRPVYRAYAERLARLKKERVELEEKLKVAQVTSA